MDSALKASSLLQLSPDWQSASCRGCCIVVGSKDLKVEIREIVEFGMYSAGQEGLFEDVTASAGFQGWRNLKSFRNIMKLNAFIQFNFGVCT